MTSDDFDDPLRRLQILQRDLIAFTESRLPNLERLSTQLDASADGLKKILERKRKSESSRALLAPSTNPQPSSITIDNVEYRIVDQFRQDALQVADELDLDELEAAKLCIESQVVGDSGLNTNTLAMRAVLRFHEQRYALLDCMRLLLQLSVDPEGDDVHSEAFRHATRGLIQGEHGGQTECSAYWRKCIDGLVDIENFLKKISEYRDKLVMTGQGVFGEQGEWLVAQRLLLTRQHECMASILAYLCQGSYTQPEDYRAFLSRAATLEVEFDITIHYLPVLISGSAYFGSDHTTNREAARDLHNLYAAGPGQLQWKQSKLKAAATMCWLAEYNSRFSLGAVEVNQSEADLIREEEARSKLFFDSLKEKAFHFILTATAYLKPVVWHDPARTALVDFLVESAVVIPSDSPRPSDSFSTMTMRELQVFADAFVTNMPDALRQLKLDEDEWRRAYLSQSANGEPQTDLDLERFMVIMACAYQDDVEAARDFWKDRESNMYGFLRWVSQRLPTPRVAAFCHLLRSIACDDRSANDAHRFLLEDTAMSSGKLRKTYAVSWAQIFSELEIYASSLKDRPSAPQTSPGGDRSTEVMPLEEPETGIMLDAYLGLAAWICRTSSEARNWLLKDQTFHLGEVMFQLARSANAPRIQACCLDLLSAMLKDKVPEVRNGIWVLMDSWLSNGGLDSASVPRLPVRPQFPAKQYLQVVANSAEASVSFVGLLTALITPMTLSLSDRTIDALPFPENLGAPNRHAGIDLYVDFVMDAVFARKIPRLSIDGEASLLDLLRYQCLDFACICLSSFNENLVLLANTTSIGIESTMETKSLATYARLHPFARVMEWLFDKTVIGSLFSILQQSPDAIDDGEGNSPLVRGVLKSLQVLVLAWQLQPTYFNLVKPAVASQPSRSPPISSTWTSLEETFLANLQTVSNIALLTATRHVEVSLGAISLLARIGSSRKVSATDMADTRQGSRMISVISPLGTSMTVQLAQDFVLYPWDLETIETPLKVVKANAVLDLLNASLDIADGKPTVAHCLLGFHCRERIIEILPESPFNAAQSLFHSIAACAATAPIVTECGNTSWLLSLKRGCLEVVLKLALAPLTSYVVRPVLRSMDFFAALSQNQILVSTSPLWDNRTTLDSYVLLSSSGAAIRDFMHVRETYFEFAAADLRAAVQQGSNSVQEKIVSALLGTIRLPNGESGATTSVFELFDFFDVETPTACDVQAKYFEGEDLSSCTRDNRGTVKAFDLVMAEELLVFRKRDLKGKGTIKDGSDADAADNEIQAILASLNGMNTLASIQSARLDALEAWTDLLSLVLTEGGLDPPTIAGLALQGLLVTLPKFERSLSDNLEAASLLAKLILSLTHAAKPASNDPSEQIVSVAMERLLETFRVSLKVITDSSADSVLRDVSYRTSCAVLAFLPKFKLTGRTPSSASAKQLLLLVQNSGERLLSVTTEDAFSGRGVTRVSSLLFLDGLVSLFQSLKVYTALLKLLMKLNFVPVLIDTSIGSVTAAFKGAEEMISTLAYFHTALALLLRLCKTPDGTQHVLNSGLFEAVSDSKLFTTDPDLGLDIDNPRALKEFYAILADILRLITVAVMQKGAQPGKSFLQQHRFTVQALFKQAARGQASNVADELSRLILATNFLEDDEAMTGRPRTNGFS